MAILIGIDEAGYGPLLGPLIISATVWRVSNCADLDTAHDVDLWTLLQRAVCRELHGAAGRFVVGDSKAVFDRKKGVGSLERSVLAFARACGICADSLGGFVASVTDGGGPAESPMPWYQSLARGLPADRVGGNPGAMGERLNESLRAGGVSCLAMFSQVVAEDAYNARVNMTRNKAALLVEHVLRLITRGVKLAAAEHVSIVVDRLGGRANYRQLLRDAWPERELSELCATETCSRYQLAAPRGAIAAGRRDQASPPPADWRIEFVVDADQQHLPVALASMLSKYLRELLMDEFNAFWAQRVPGLRPTAGYYNDAQRFLADIEPHISACGIPATTFVRAR